MKHLVVVSSFVAGIVACLAFIFIVGFDNEPGKSKERCTPAPQVMGPPALPQTLSFAGESVPLDRWEVREQLDRELLHIYYQTGNVLYVLKLARKYFPQIEAQLKANNIPDDFKWLCVAESNLQNLISRAGATGFWQFMPSSGPGFGLELSPSVDERYHVARSTQAACTYLKKAYDRFGNWTAAAASYNCGIGGFGQRSTAQGSTNYYKLILPDETQRYVFRILAFKHILSNADSLGFRIPAEQYYPPLKVKTITVDRSIPNLVAFAKENGSDYKELRWLNPWLRGNSLLVRSGKNYELVLPIK
jgi:membrane-bound lytic murein transglycosylase D